MLLKSGTVTVSKRSYECVRCGVQELLWYVVYRNCIYLWILSGIYGLSGSV